MKRHLIVVLATLATAQAAWADPAPLHVTSITPAVADRGELVTIAGEGFGADNLRVTLGGDPVALLSATGSRATFRVPRLSPVGEVTVAARNPGGHHGAIRLTIRFDGVTEAVADASAAVSQPIGADGGMIEVEGMRLAFPAGAVPEGTTITATPLRSLQGSPFAAAPVGLKLEPSGLVLLQPATLTLPRPQGEGVVVGFGFDGDGDGFHLVPASGAGDTVQLRVWHFSGAGTLTARLSELGAVLDYETTRAESQAEQRIAAALADAARNGSDPAQAIFDALVDWRRSVSNGLQVAWDTARLDFFELAFGEWQAWQAYVQEYRDSLSPAQGATLDTFIRVDRDVATQAAYDIGLSALTRCVGPGVPRSALRDVLRLATAVVLASLPIEQANDPDERRLPSGDGLGRACISVELLEFEHAPTFARNRDNRFTARAHVVFWAGPASDTVPLRYRLRDASAGPTAPLASGTSATGSYEDAVSPAALGIRQYELTVDLDASGGDAVLRAFFDRRTDTVPVRERLDLQARRPVDAVFADNVGTVAPAGTVSLRVRLAGDDIAGKTITFTHDAAGVLAASATTDANGDAFLTYVAPAFPQIELVNATVTDNGLATGDAIVITTRQPVNVTVTPSFGFVSPGQTIQFTAAVTATTNTAVIWNATGGTVDGNGLYTAGSTGGIFAVTATSVADPSASGTAFVQITAADVTGIYAGDRCYPASGFCEPVKVSYSCAFQSSVGNGTVCGWFSSEFAAFVPAIVPFCLIETTGTKSGGAFTGRITSCRFSPASDYSGVFISGSIGDGRLVFQVRVSDYPDPGATHVESYDLSKIP